MNIIDIDFSKIPVENVVEIDGVDYIFIFKMRAYDKKIVVDLLDSNRKILAENEKLTFGVPLWIWMLSDGFGNRRIEFPKKNIIPWSIDGKEKEISMKTLGKEMFLCVVG